MAAEQTEERWRAHPWLGRLLQVAIVLTPVVVSLALTWTVLDLWHPHGHRLVWLVLLCLGSLLVGAGVERALRRFTPLATLLRLTMLFPDKAPSRLKVARSAGSSKRLIKRLGRHPDGSALTTSEKVLALITALGNHDRRTRGHSERVRVFAEMLAAELRLPDRDRDKLRWAALLHDIGKLNITPAILNKPAKLDDHEFARMKQHPDMGAELAAPLMAWLGDWGLGIPQHHERWDGRGYPRGLSQADISSAGRILNVVDAFETMTAARPYKKPMATRAAREELARCAGSQFDPDYVRAFLAISLPRLFLAMGPLSFVVQLPFLRSIAEAGSKASFAGAQAATAAAAGVATVATAGALGAGAPPSHPTADRPARPAATRQHPAPAPRPSTPAPSAARPARPPRPSHPAPPAPPAPPATVVPVSDPSPPPSPTPSPTPAPPTPAPPTPTPSPTPTPTPTPSAPSAPVGAQAVAGDRSALVSWQPPAADGGAALTGFTVTPLDGSTALAPVEVGPGATSTTVNGLTDGTTYTFTVVAINPAGTSPTATTNAVTPTGVPTKPRHAAATAGDGAATVSWSAPADDRGSAVTDYTVTPFDGSTTLTPVTVDAGTTSTTVTGLTDGTAYTFAITAQNANGSSRGAATPAVTPTGRPSAPTDVRATPADSAATVHWQAPGSDGGLPITGYTVTPSDGTTTLGPLTVDGSTTTATINGLTNGTAYTFTVVATNAAGDSPAATSAPVTPATVPGAPQNVVATATDRRAAVTWDAPATDGGSPITGYTVTAWDGSTEVASASGDAAELSATLSGLTDGRTYHFTVTARNAIGDSPPAASNDVVPGDVPDRPHHVRAYVGDGEAVVSWLPPQRNNGAPVTSYTVTPVDEGVAQTPVVIGGSTPSTTVTGLTDGDDYWFLVTAQNSFGSSAPGRSQHVTPVGPPSRPQNVSASPGDGQATVSWQPPAADGGVAVSGYTITPYDGSTALAPVKATAGATTVTVPGLTDGTTYTFEVTAQNRVGSSPSATTNAVTPVGPPTMPRNVAAVGDESSAIVTWAAPANDGGVPLTGYTVTPYDGSTALSPVTVGAGSTSVTVTGLTDGTSYTFAVTAANSLGSSPAAVTGAVAPTDVPSSPQAASAVAGPASATVSWTAPLSDGGSALTGYTITPFDGSTALAPVTVGAGATSTTITGLTNGTTYTFDVTAQNPNGTSPAATTNAATPSDKPAAPALASATAGDGTATVTWTAPTDDGGSPITGYTITPYAGSTALAPESVGPSTTSGTFTGLTDGESYSFEVTAQNANGSSPAITTNSVTPTGVPGAPQNATATAGDGTATVTWSPPASDGGLAVTSYTVTPFIGGTAQAALTVGAGTTSADFSGLTDGTSYSFTVTAHNADGDSAAATTNAVTPSTTPSAPRNPTATGGDGSATVSWSAPANDGGSPVTGYTVTPYAGSTALSPVTVGAGTTTTTVTGLIDGTSYTFRITADNANGSSPAATTNAVTPTLLAAPPTNVQAAADDASATVWWTAPITGPTVTGYTVSAWDSSGNLVTTTSVDASETTAIVPGLVDGDSYTFTVAAQSTLGSSGASSPSNSVTPYSASGVAKPPNPTKLTATGLLGSATITWVAPKAPNNGAVTSYTVTVYDSKNTVVETLLFDPNTTSVTIGGLTGGTQYKFKIASTNVAGSSGGAMTPLITVL